MLSVLVIIAVLLALLLLSCAGIGGSLERLARCHEQFAHESAPEPESGALGPEAL